MRLISQDSIWDIPYERVIVASDIVNPNVIKAYDGIYPDAYVELGVYDSEKFAIEVLMEMRTAYRDGKTYFYFP